jgi:predicted nucleic acid-binding protein
VRLIVPDSSVLIALQSLKCFEHFDKLTRSNNWRVEIPDLVIKETGNIAGSSKFSSFRIRQVDKRHVEQLANRFPTLGDGELSVLALILDHGRSNKADPPLAIFDDKVARAVAKKLGIGYFGTLRLLKIMCDKQIISSSEFIRGLEVLKRIGFRFKESTIEELLKEG